MNLQVNTAQTIDGVIAELDKIIDWCHDRNSRQGYFPALYRKVTVAVKEGIRQNFFEDGPRMEQLDVVFANRYLEAFRNFQARRPLTASWQVSFDSSAEWSPVVLQHLLLGMNAHISLDLGIAAAQTVPQGRIEELQTDFNRINEVLSNLIDQVQQELSEIWPLLRFFDLKAGQLDETLARFGIEFGRDQAWKIAGQLNALPPDQREDFIDTLDLKIARVSGFIRNPPKRLFRWTLLLIRCTELQSPRRVIDLLR